MGSAIADRHNGDPSNSFYRDMLRFFDTLGPIYFDDHPATNFYLVNRYDLVMAALQDVRLTVDRVDDMFAELPSYKSLPIYKGLKKMFAFMEGKEHQVLRAFAAKAFSPAKMELYRVNVHQIGQVLLNDCLQKGEFNAIADFAAPLSGRASAKFIGYPIEDIPMLQPWIRAIGGFISSKRANEEIANAANNAWIQFEEYLHGKLIPQHKAAQQDDLISMLLADTTLTTDQFLSTVVSMIIGAQATITEHVGGIVEWFVSKSNADQAAQLKKEPDGTNYIESVVRWGLRVNPPIVLDGRKALTDISIEGETIPAGSLVQLNLGCAHNPENLTLGEILPDLGFGYGPHGCVGQKTGLAAARVATRLWTEMMPLNIAVNGATPYIPQLAFHGLMSLPLKIM